MLLDPTEIEKFVTNSRTKVPASKFRSSPEGKNDEFIPIFKRGETHSDYLSQLIASTRKYGDKFASSEYTLTILLLLLLGFLFKFQDRLVLLSNSTPDITNYPGPKKDKNIFTEQDSSLLDITIDNAILTSEFFVDTNGKRIHAHGGGMIQRNGLFYWYGTTVKESPNWLSNGVNLYTSSDLKTWKFEAQVFRNSSIEAP